MKINLISEAKLSGASRAFLRTARRAGKAATFSNAAWKLFHSPTLWKTHPKGLSPKEARKGRNDMATAAELAQEDRDTDVQRAERLMTAIPTSSSRNKARDEEARRLGEVPYRFTSLRSKLQNRAYPSE